MIRNVCDDRRTGQNFVRQLNRDGGAYLPEELFTCILLEDDVIPWVFKKPHCNFKSPLMKTLDWSVEQQWRNVISGGPRFKLFEGPPQVDVPKAQVERRICTSFLGVQGMLTRKVFESRLSEMPFPGLWREILQNSGQKTALLLWAWEPPLGLGAPEFSRSEPIVVTPLVSKRWVLITIRLGIVFIYINQSSERKHDE
jgi:hypothetical protein